MAAGACPLGRPASHLPAANRYTAPPPQRAAPEAGRDLEQAYRVLVEVIRDLRSAGRKLVFPNVQEGLWRRLGQFDVEQYGFFKFKEFLQEAARRNIISLGLVDGVDYVALPGESPQAAPAGMPSSLEDLSLEERNRFLQTIAQLEARSAYMIRSYIARHLTASAILPLPMYEVRALVNDAVNRGLFQRGTRPFRHPATGEMQSLETLILDRGHPWVADALASQPEPAAEDTEDEEPALPRDAGGWDRLENNSWEDRDPVPDDATPPAPIYQAAADSEDELDARPRSVATNGVVHHGNSADPARPALNHRWDERFAGDIATGDDDEDDRAY